MIFERKLYQEMLDWKREFDGRTALLIKGARRVGKTTLAEEFAKREYDSYILIDFSVASAEVRDLFKDISDLNYLFLRLQMIYHVDLVERKSVIIFDEVQMQPLARQAVKHLVKDRRYDYIETGSLLSIRKNVKDIVIPSEETRVQLYPMDYEEFRWSLGDKVTMPLLRDAFENLSTLGDDLNRRLLRDFRVYMLVGGMPQAVDAYITTNNMSMVDRIRRNVIELYEEDFRKIDPTGRAGMALYKDPSRYKLFLCDTGLFVTLAFKDREYTENEIYDKLLNDKMGMNLGYLYKSMVAQMLKTAGNELFYYTFPKETSNHSYEVDFLLSRGGKICPLEVKSSRYKTHALLDAFRDKFSERIQSRYLIYTKDLRKDRDIICLPIYMVPFL